MGRWNRGSRIVAFTLIALVAGLALGGHAWADPPKPTKKDTTLAIRPKNAVLTTAVEPDKAKPGDVVTFKVTAKLDPGAHIYKYSREAGPGPVSTSFDFFDTGGLKIEGDWTASKEPKREKDSNFPDLDVVEFFEHEVTWSVKLKIPEGTPPGKLALRCQARYMVCTSRNCSIPGQWTLPAAELTIVGGKAQPPANAVAAASPTEKTPPPPPPAELKPSEPAPTAVVQSEIARKAEQGLLPFLIASALGGLFALVMPCVWPMVPVTVNFFVKQGTGEHGRRKSVGLAFVYCLAIIGIFTAVGVFFSFFFSASALQKIANNPWLNFAVAGLFLAFGLSLLGLFEIGLPSFLLNASAKGEGRGGLVGVFFMALTLTITSFTCTFPVVGGLLVMAANGSFLYPILGLATFATVLALPFFLLALSPGLITSLPKSGDWMNAVKVVGGLVEIGAALKFINTAELAYVTPENAWFDAQVVLTCWVALSAVSGLYLLGIFRTDHDYEEVKVGAGRMILGTLFMALALYMAPALFGNPPQSLVWDRLVVGILPPDAGEFSAGGRLAAASVEPSATPVKAVSNDPAQAERQEKSVHGVLWGMSLDQARELAKTEKKPILIDFTGVNCSNCRLMERRVFPRPEVVELLKKFVTVQLYTDFVPINSISADQREELATRNQGLLLDLAQEQTNPFYVVLSPEGKVIGKTGFSEPPDFLAFLSKALSRASSPVAVAESDASR